MRLVPTLRALLLMAASLSLSLGLTLPFVRLERFFVFDEAASLVELTGGLWGEGEWALAALVGLFSIAFPLAKLAVAHIVSIADREPPGWLFSLSRWSMVDVVLVALVIFAAKTTGLASAVTAPGLWFYVVAALCTYASVVLAERR